MLAVADWLNAISIVCPTIVLTILPGVAGAGDGMCALSIQSAPVTVELNI